MRTTAMLTIVLLVGAASLFMIGCQSKEVTSAKVYIQQDDWEKATEQLERAVELYPQDAEAHFLLGQAYAVKGNFAGVRKEFDASLAVSNKFEPRITHELDKHWVSYFNNGVKKVNAGKMEEAKKDFETCLEIDPDRPDAYKNLGYTYVQTEDVEAAIKAYEKAIELNPEDADGMRSLTSLYLQEEEYPKVLSICEKRLELDPTDVDAVSNMALSYDYMGEQEKARDTYLKALENDPSNADLLFNLGRLYYLRGDYEDAIEEFKKVIEQNPEDYDANVNVGNAYLSIGDHIRKKAIEEEEAGKKFSEDELDALKKEIESYHCGAVPFLETAVRVGPENAGAWYNLGVAYVNCGEAEKGGECFDIEKALKEGSTKEAQDFVEKYLTKE